MKYLIPILCIISASACSVQNKIDNNIRAWQDVVVIQDLEVYVDTLNIRQQGDFIHAYVKNLYTTEDSQLTYTNKIKNSFKDQNSKLDNKMKKWENFSYNISLYEFDCLNKRYRILEVTDYNNKGDIIIKTHPNKNNLKWTNVGIDTMGDYTLFYVCDYPN